MEYCKYVIILSFCIGLNGCSNETLRFKKQVTEVLRDSVLVYANDYLREAPKTVTSDFSSRSEGSIHDFFSEGDYWWPDTNNIDGPYIRKDGMSNPENFTAHRESLIRFSEMVGALTSAFMITQDTIYAHAAIDHCRAWFVEDSSKMNPNLLYAQAIKGRHSGRGIGIIDGIHFMEVVQSLIVLEQEGMIDEKEMVVYRKWFGDFVAWLTTHPYGRDEMVHPNNHGTCWNMQVGLYAKFTRNDSILNFCRENFKQVLLPNQMAENGSFPKELKRTKPYGYSLFNLDAMVMNYLVLSDESNKLWEFTTSDGKNIHLGLEFLAPYVRNKGKWNLEPDIMYWENWPVAQPSFLFGAIQFNSTDYFNLWKNNTHFPTVFEVKRNMPIRNPLLWINETQ